MANESAGDSDPAKEVKTCVVLGGRSFIGRALVERLLKLGNWIVRVADFAESPELHSSESLLSDAFASRRATYFKVDVRHKSKIVRAIQGVSIVFYTDSLDSFPRDFYFCYTIIVQGAKNVVNACRECKVKRLIYNSTANVIVDSKLDICCGDESMPYAGQFKDMVTDLKAQAEAVILFANDIDVLSTCALRPCTVFGPGDKELIPSLVNIAKSSWAKFIIGSNDNLSDFIFVDNVAHAHICAEESLNSRVVSASGKAFLITNLEPMKFWDFASLVLDGLGYMRPVISLPVRLVHFVIFLVKLMHLKTDSRKLDTCLSVYYVAALASSTRTFSCSAAQKHLEYSPIVRMEEAVALTIHSFYDLASDLPPLRYKDSDEPSKVDRLLGSGKVADILLWRDEKKTFFCFLLLFLLYHWFFLSGRTFISSLAGLLLLVVLLLCGHHVLPLIMGPGFNIPRLPSSWFEISEVNTRNTFLGMVHMWNRLCCMMKKFAEGKDWSSFLKVSAFLYVCKLVVPHFFTLAVGVGLVLSFSLGFVYEQYDKEIDEIAIAIFSCGKDVMSMSVRSLPFPPS